MENNWFIASVWMALALGASLISIRIGLSVALAEILVGIIGGNFLGLHTTAWIDFLAGFGAVLLTFLAGAEIDPVSFRRHFKASMAIGAVSFLFPFLGAGLFAYFVVHWDLRAAEIAGIALSTTSVAVVYAVMVETRLSETDLGKLILAACFVTDLGTVLALGILFANFNLWLLIFIGATIPTLWLLPKAAPWVIANWGKRVSEPEVKFFFIGVRESNYTTLLMSTGLTFGSISALFGLNNGFIDRSQYTILVTGVIGSAVIPTLIAQTWFIPRVTSVRGGKKAAETLATGEVAIADAPSQSLPAE